MRSCSWKRLVNWKIRQVDGVGRTNRRLHNPSNPNSVIIVQVPRVESQWNPVKVSKQHCCTVPTTNELSDTGYNANGRNNIANLSRRVGMEPVLKEGVRNIYHFSAVKVALIEVALERRLVDPVRDVKRLSSNETAQHYSG